ncbi:MAG: SUMF1/EgtB/PvdO family nonheme iron enzyme, partial [Anaerolineae bacterium]|nr:SUMF1/EgtB/PvdO family nonheme iron enzyme [Anaerolineae bacterium]
NASDSGTCDGYEETAPVGSFLAGVSPYGLLDMAGNVWEWVSSLYEGYPYDAEDGRENMDAGDNRVLRGGSWFNADGVVRSANRYRNSPSVTVRQPRVSLCPLAMILECWFLNFCDRREF